LEYWYEYEYDDKGMLIKIINDGEVILDIEAVLCG
jgi:hypothetical protein